VVDSTDTSYDCTPELTLNGVTTDLEPMNYNEDITPYLDAVTPRFGSERGGETVTFTGVGFSGTPTVIIDDLECTGVTFTSTQITCTP
jgi:hypothetical protein